MSIFIGANLLTLFSPDNRDTIAGLGSMIVIAAFVAGVVYLIKRNSSRGPDPSDPENSRTSDRSGLYVHGGNHDNETKEKQPSNKVSGGWIVPLLIVVAALVLSYPVLSNYQNLYFVGSIAAIALSIGIGVYLYNSHKDE